jgi:hypothetical protein
MNRLLQKRGRAGQVAPLRARKKAAHCAAFLFYRTNVAYFMR